METESLNETRLAELVGQLADRHVRGELVDIEKVCREHAEFASDLRPLLATMFVADVASQKRSSSLLATTAAPRLPSPISLLSLPCQFGEYTLVEELGRGGMGVVYRADQPALQREVAIKMILRGPMASSGERDRFRAEAEANAKLEHPGIVPVYEVGEADGRPYFSMKLIRGETLAYFLSNGPFSPREGARILASVARAIHFAHERGILHRDLKPSNILIDESGQPHVTDFGLAKQWDDPESLTRTGAILGTPAYMAPEQAAGIRGAIGPASDVYSLGVILYHMLTGRPPFQAASPVDLVLMVREQDPVPPRLLNPKANRDLEMIAMRCLQKPTDLRYSSAEALASDLEAYLKDESIAARSGRFSQVIAGWLRETHHAVVLENWGLLWMWHSLALLVLCLLTNALALMETQSRWQYFLLWTTGLGAWAWVFWALRRRMGPVTFVERQIAHCWAASLIGTSMLFPIEAILDLPVLTLSPVVAIIAAMVFVVKAGILSGEFYLQAGVMFATAAIMAAVPKYSHAIFGLTAAWSFFFPGLKYYRQRARSESSDGSTFARGSRPR